LRFSQNSNRLQYKLLTQRCRAWKALHFVLTRYLVIFKSKRVILVLIKFFFSKIFKFWNLKEFFHIKKSGFFDFAARFSKKVQCFRIKFLKQSCRAWKALHFVLTRYFEIFSPKKVMNNFLSIFFCIFEKTWRILEKCSNFR
jgi:hypothetical protein